MTYIELHPTKCAICDVEDNATELYPANFDREAFNPAVFSARRLPDRIHYRMVRCNTCGLVRADPVADPQTLAWLYAQSSFDYVSEVDNLNATYGRYLAQVSVDETRKGSLLEIGCGNGFFLEEALRQGFEHVRGVEPSAAAIAQASERIRPLISCEVMRPGLFAPERFDMICMFQVLDHVPDPGATLAECFHVLKPAGRVLCITHNVEAFSARLLKETSPIVDVEHTYLYSPSTISELFSTNGFQVNRTGAVYNDYTLYYLARLVPLPSMLKSLVLTFLKRVSILGRTRLSLPLGNVYCVAQKPE